METGEEPGRPRSHLTEGWSKIHKKRTCVFFIRKPVLPDNTQAQKPERGACTERQQVHRGDGFTNAGMNE